MLFKENFRNFLRLTNTENTNTETSENSITVGSNIHLDYDVCYV